MKQLKSIKGIIFDYGSALDVSGRNWLHPIHQAYASMGIDIPKDIVHKGMVEIATNALNTQENSTSYYYSLKDFFISKANRHFLWLSDNHPHLLKDVTKEELSHKIARHCYDYSRTNALEVGNILRDLAKKYRLALVSSFNGNLESVLEDFGLKQYFAIVTTSPPEQIPKTAEDLFKETIRAMGLLPRDVLVVGDSISRDIIPATTLGCQTAWLQSILNPVDGAPTQEVLPQNTIRLKSLTDLRKMMVR